MGRIKSVGRANPVSKGLASKSNLYLHQHASPQPSMKERSHAEKHEPGNDTIDLTEEPQSEADNSRVQDYPSPAITLDDAIEIKARIRRNGRKKYPSDVPRTPRPPYLPPVMQTGCILITKFKCLTAPTAEANKPDWDVMKYCLDCLRPHIHFYCDGTHKLVEHECAFHRDNPDSTLRINEYARIRKRIENQFFAHGILDSRPFSPPILEHYPDCRHQNEEAGFDPKVLKQIQETASWGKNLSQEQIQAAASAKIDTPKRTKGSAAAAHRFLLHKSATVKPETPQRNPGPSSIPPRPPADQDIIMIDD